MVRNNPHHMLLTLSLITILCTSFVNGYADEGPLNISESVTKKRQAELHNLLIQDCGSCHGMTMKGGLGPALTTDVLKTKSREMIEVTISQGRPGTPMPPWNRILTKKEIRWIVDTLYAGIK